MVADIESLRTELNVEEHQHDPTRSKKRTRSNSSNSASGTVATRTDAGLKKARVHAGVCKFFHESTKCPFGQKCKHYCYKNQASHDDEEE